MGTYQQNVGHTGAVCICFYFQLYAKNEKFTFYLPEAMLFAYPLDF